MNAGSFDVRLAQRPASPLIVTGYQMSIFTK